MIGRQFGWKVSRRSQVILETKREREINERFKVEDGCYSLRYKKHDMK